LAAPAPPINGERCRELIALERLLSKEAYIDLIRAMAQGKVVVEEIESLLDYVKGDRTKLEKILVGLANRLYQINKPVIYPIETIVIPRYPFSKRPIIEWGSLKAKDFKDPEVNRIKDVSSRLGYLINSAFIGKHFVLIDIDSENLPAKIDLDVKTRRGFHKLFYIPEYPAVLFKVGGNPSTKYKVKCGGIDIELISGSNYLISNPLQSRFIVFDGSKFNIEKYKIISKRAENSFYSADLTPLSAKLDDVKDFICEMFKAFGCDAYCKEFEVKGLEKEEYSSDLPNVNPKESRFNSNPLAVVGSFSYTEFKAELEKHSAALPECVKQALFGRIEKGHRYFHLRLLVAILPFFVEMTKENIEAFVKDFSERTNSTMGELRSWLYDTYYFAGKLEVNGSKISAPSRFGVPAEAWSDFEALGYCSRCLLAEKCRNSEGSQRRKILVSYLETLLGEPE